MNFIEKEKAAHKEKKMARRQKFFGNTRPYTSRKASKLRCGINGCPNEATKLRGTMPCCNQHR